MQATSQSASFETPPKRRTFEPPEPCRSCSTSNTRPSTVFAAGAGANSDADRKLTVDRDGAILLADASVRAGVQRMIVVSSMGADGFDADSDDVFQVYLRAKSEADAAVRQRQLDWTIVRPGALTDAEPTALVTVGKTVDRGSIARADVAAIILALLVDVSGVGRQFEVISGQTPITEALAALPLD
jgi:uncharacterized protein YbjT (DUF2867 family)